MHLIARHSIQNKNNKIDYIFYFAEDIVEDEEADYVTPPSVFISYQWGLQNEVKLLKNHLEMAGFTWY